MKLADLSPEARRRVAAMRFDTDMTFFTGMDAGFVAVCEKVPDADWYIALLYHEWFVIDDVPTQYRRTQGTGPAGRAVRLTADRR